MAMDVVVLKTATGKEGSSTSTLREIKLVRSAAHDGASAHRSASAVKARVYRMLLCTAVHKIIRSQKARESCFRRGVAGLKAVRPFRSQSISSELAKSESVGRSQPGEPSRVRPDKKIQQILLDYPLR